jgi:poly-gamma-glutamate synthesis protein (capsule biosynthesis protein)
VRTEGRIVLGAVGDVLMHGAVKACAAAHRPAPGALGAELEGYDWLYAQVGDLLAQPDLTFANLETPIAPGADKGSRSFVFNAPPAAARALRHAGIGLVSVANNHLFDQGRDGFLETLAQLDGAGLRYVGAGPSPAEAGPRRIEVNGLSLAFLAWSRFFNERGNDCPVAPGPCLRAALLDAQGAVAAVRAAAAQAEAVVVSLHWGEEYASQPREEDVALARRIADAGALVILGHHPHVLQPIELYRRADGQVALIAYSLGNFISNQSRRYVHGITPERAAAARDGALLRVELARRDYGRGVRRVELAAVDYLPLWTENDTADLDRRRDPKAHPSIRVVSIDRSLAAVRAELASFPDPVPLAEQARWVELRRRERLYLARRAAIAAVLGEELQAEPAASRAR